MKLVAITLQNFRCYQDPITTRFDNLTTFIGKNDIGKSTILEALEIFFNNATVKIEPQDVHIRSADTNISITCEFTDLPPSLSLDAGAETSLSEEYLLTTERTLKIKKVFDCSKKTPTLEVFILANHPTAPEVGNLLELKEKELQQLVRARGLTVALKGNPGMRAAIWQSTANLQLANVEIPVSKPKEDCKRIWEQLETHLPMFALFQSDRNSRDSDGEVQDPLKAAIAAAIAEVQPEITRIQQRVQEKAEEIVQRTHEALKTIDPNLANDLTPQFTPPTAAKWNGLFSISMETDQGIPLNKRGSGIRRMILVSFFKAEAERRLVTSAKRSIIYAIEEPETAQHPNNQRILINSFKTLVSEPGCQVILTTHSPGFAADLPLDGIRFVTRDAAGNPVVDAGVDVFGAVADTLGLTPDSRVKVLICVEGPTDVPAFRYLSSALHQEDPSIPNLDTDERIAFVVLGGGTLKHWVSEHYLKGLGCPEVHIYDSDVNAYGATIDAINQRADGKGSWGALTTKHEIENYLHPSAIQAAFNVTIPIDDQPGADGKSVPKLFGEAFSLSRGHGAPLGENKAKAKLAEQAFPKMTAALIRERDPAGEVEGWLRRIAGMLNV